MCNFHHANLQNAGYTYKLSKFTPSYKISNINLMLINLSLSVHYNTIPTPHSNQFQLFHNSGR